MSEEERKEIEVVSGDGTEIDISPVGEHLIAMKPKSKEENYKKNIVIPEVKDNTNKNYTNEEDVENSEN